MQCIMKSSGQNSFIPGPLIILYTIFIAVIKGKFRFRTGQEKASQGLQKPGRLSGKAWGAVLSVNFEVVAAILGIIHRYVGYQRGIIDAAVIFR